MITTNIDIDYEQIATFCRKWGIRELALFGSVLRDDFRPDSDVDVLFTMAAGAPCGFDEFWGMKEELERMFGRQVDFVQRQLVEESPNWIRRKHILGTCRTIYAAQ